MRIGNELHLDVTSRIDRFLYIHPVVTKSAFGFATCCSQRRWQVLRISHKADTFAAAASSGLQQQRIAYSLSDMFYALIVHQISHGSGNNWYTCYLSSTARGGLLSHSALY